MIPKIVLQRLGKPYLRILSPVNIYLAQEQPDETIARLPTNDLIVLLVVRAFLAAQDRRLVLHLMVYIKRCMSDWFYTYRMTT